MNSPTLSLVITDDVEKGPHYLRWCLFGLRELNAAGLADAEVYVLTQRQRAGEVGEICAAQPFPVDVIHAREETVDGYPVWDTCAEMRRILPLLRGQYLCQMHTEFLWHPGRLAATARWLRDQRPWIALGNLRRFGTPQETADWHLHRGDSNRSDVLTRAIDQYELGERSDLDAIRELVESAETLHWVYWRKPPEPGAHGYSEDLLFVALPWVRAMRFFDHATEKPFQDVYDLWSKMLDRLKRHKLYPPVWRMPQCVNRVLHLHHPKHWSAWTPAMRDWFLARPERWADTRFLDARLWGDLIAGRAESWASTKAPVIAMRQGPGGTATRFAVAASEWLQQGGADRLRDFYLRYGRDKWEIHP